MSEVHPLGAQPPRVPDEGRSDIMACLTPRGHAEARARKPTRNQTFQAAA